MGIISTDDSAAVEVYSTDDSAAGIQADLLG